MRPPRAPPILIHKDVLHRHPTSQHSIPNQRPVTPPWHRLRAHHHRSIHLRQPNQPIYLLRKLRSLHVIRIPSETLIPPPQIHAVLLRHPPPTQPLPPNPTNPHLRQRVKQSRLPKPRIPPGPRKPPHIH